MTALRLLNASLPVISSSWGGRHRAFHPDRQFELIMRFSDYSDPAVPYMCHCHLLRHEDNGMMGQSFVVKPGGSQPCHATQ